MTDTTQSARDIHRAIQGMSLDNWLDSAHCNSDQPRDMQELFHRIGNENSEDDFVNFVTTGEIGGVELSDGELDMVAGGGQRQKAGKAEHTFACLVL